MYRLLSFLFVILLRQSIVYSQKGFCLDTSEDCPIFKKSCHAIRFDFVLRKCPGTCTRFCPITEETAITSWFNVGQCSVSCGGGIQRQERLCLLSLTNNRFVNVSKCASYELERTIPCNTACCPSPGYTEWVNDGSCNSECGVGFQKQLRNCFKNDCDWKELVRHVPCYNGPCGSLCADEELYCEAYKKQCDNTTHDFILKKCPKTCQRFCSITEARAFSPWVNIGHCSESCGDGVQKQRRSCLVVWCDPRNLEREVLCNNGCCPPEDA